MVLIAIASHLRGLGSATSGLSWLLGICSAPRGFPLSSKINFSKFQFDRMRDLPENHFRVSGDSRVNINNYYYYRVNRFR